MRLSELLTKAGFDSESGALPDLGAVEIQAVTHDSAQVEPGGAFIALPGQRTHGARFADEACARGARVIFTDGAGALMIRKESAALSCPVVELPEIRQAMAHLAAACFGNPAKQLAMLGVTGTNGKTSVSFLVAQALRSGGRSCGVIGTLGSFLGDTPVNSGSRTTPESPDLQRTLASMARDGADCVAMEVSSIAVCEHRVDAMMFDVMGFTGLSHDHLDYHHTMDTYFGAKSELFTPQHSRVGVVVTDGPWGRRLAKSANIPIITVNTTGARADWTIHPEGDGWLIHGPESARLQLTIPTDFAVANSLLAIAMAHTQGIPASQAAQAVASARVPGRMELVASISGIDFVVDYAHSPDAIEQVVGAAVRDRALRGGRVIVVVGAGGDRDQHKRPAMGAATQGANLVIVTDDNPRHEDPAIIRRAVRQGVESVGVPVQEIGSRSDAIAHAVETASTTDIVLILGKGHETTQEVAGEFLPFDDRAVLASFVRDRFGSQDGEQGGGA